MEPVGNVRLPDRDDHKGIDELARSSVFSLRHPSGTAAMSRKGNKEGVVDPSLRLKGAAGVRIVDASVFPFLPGTHTHTPVFIVAERAADLLKKEGGNR
ncbi:hypothetical protein E1B28_013235 [Marasmius oreades]|uniref:Glucose-methanol-choline oxidoreductase C-terminal domain-containing protein n=1 Tax=Marasmius oreades TaxID=181124 RepID=A0A9P7RP62_9AGAR|nr:uncharacterized protein E1B28_013235 [Marasmius oreades]KAG7087254.1 hypothetical protein E1B28_013235 [Marasmius oreades]